jgi:hypothetical protein
LKKNGGTSHELVMKSVKEKFPKAFK